jgi:putative peptide zinc metalloprotease protein
VGAEETAVANAVSDSAAPAAVPVWDQVRESLSLANYRPRLRPDLTWARLKTRRGTPYIILADRGVRYWRLTPEDDFLASRMDGTRSVSDLVIEYFHQYGRFGFDRTAELVSDLRNWGFLEDPPRNIYTQLETQLHPLPVQKQRRWEGTPLRLKLPVKGIDPLVTAFYQRIGWVFFKRPMLYLIVAVSVLGFAAFIAELRRGRDPFAPIGDSGLAGLIALIIAYYFVVFVHESGHALTCKHFGRRVDEGGFMLYYFVPAFYVNVIDAWLEPWNRRIAIFWAGPYSGLVVAGVASILVWLFPGSGVLAIVLFKVALAAYINDTFNLMPLLLFDGYWILEEWTETPLLRQKALNFIKGPLWHLLLDRKRLTRREVFYAIFGALCAVYSFVSIYLAFLYWGRRIKPIVRPLWATPGLLAKVLVALVLAFVAIPLGIRFGRQLWRYQMAVRRAPAAAKRALTTIRTRDRLRLLEGLGFLNSLPLASLERLARAARVREASAGSTVVRQGERGDEFFIIAEGNAEVLVRESGEDTVVERLGVGDFFGERALLGTGIRQATVAAASRFRLLVIDQRTFWQELSGTVAWEVKVRAALDERQRLRDLPLFAGAAPRQLDLLAVKLQIRAFQPGEVLLRQGDPGDAFYIVREGSVEVVGRQDRRSKRLSILKAGDFFGEVALLRNQPRSATVRGMSEGSVWRLERDDFRELVGRYLNLEGHIAGVADARVPRGHSVLGSAA